VILVDTNVLVALVDKRDRHQARAARDLRRAQGKALFVIEPVLSEACFSSSRSRGTARAQERRPHRGFWCVNRRKAAGAQFFVTGHSDRGDLRRRRASFSVIAR
jgi:predicted nucleic acid-binding protein